MSKTPTSHRIKWLRPNSQTTDTAGDPVFPGQVADVAREYTDRYWEGIDYEIEPPPAKHKPKTTKTTKTTKTKKAAKAPEA